MHHPALHRPVTLRAVAWYASNAALLLLVLYAAYASVNVNY